MLRKEHTLWISMNADHADMFMILQKAIRITESLREHRSKNCLMTGNARFAA